jgi:hypothetical protein
MTAASITFAKVGGPPNDWRNLQIFDGDEKVADCIEVNTVAGYALVHARDAQARFELDGEKLAVRRLESKSLRIEVTAKVQRATVTA